MPYIIGFAAGQVFTLVFLYMGYNWSNVNGRV